MFSKTFSEKVFLTVFIGLIVILITAGLGCKEPVEEETAALSPVAKPVEKPAELEEIKPPTEAVSPEEKTKPLVEPEEKEAVVTIEDEQAIVLKQAEKIAQIFGTYATTDNPPFRNLRDLKDYGTDHFNSWLGTIIKDQAPSGSFQGWATETISSAILESSFDSIKILITCKKEEFLETQKTPKVSFEMLMIDFKKVEEEWKVDRAEWL